MDDAATVSHDAQSRENRWMHQRELLKYAVARDNVKAYFAPRPSTCGSAILDLTSTPPRL
jgi:hypothetical protein